MRYIRTKDGIIGICTHEDNKNVRIKYHDDLGNHCPLFSKKDILKQADTIEELCDEFVCQENDNFYWLASRENVSFRDLPNCYCKAIFGAIWTDKGLIYVAKMNDKGELELL